MDRGYNDYRLIFKWTTEEIYFVTRLKENAAYEVVEEFTIPKDRNILSDQLIAILLLKWLHHLSKAKWSLSAVHFIEPSESERTIHDAYRILTPHSVRWFIYDRP
jgi:hypothetical protein